MIYVWDLHRPISLKVTLNPQTYPKIWHSPKKIAKNQKKCANSSFSWVDYDSDIVWANIVDLRRKKKMPELASGSARGLLLVQLCFKSDSLCVWVGIVWIMQIEIQTISDCTDKSDKRVWLQNSDIRHLLHLLSRGRHQLWWQLRQEGWTAMPQWWLAHRWTFVLHILTKLLYILSINMLYTTIVVPCQDRFFTDLISTRGLGIRGWPSGKTEMLRSVVTLPKW